MATRDQYQLQGSGGVQSNIGTYTYSKNGHNTGFLVETEESGTMVQNTLTFNSVNSGIHPQQQQQSRRLAEWFVYPALNS